MKKGLVFATIACALSLGLAACNPSSGGGGDSENYTVEITNKSAIAEIFSDDKSQSVSVKIEGVVVADAFLEGDLVVTSSDTSVLTITGNNKITPVAVGETTVKAVYKGKFSDEATVKIVARPAMRVVKDVTALTEESEYYLGLVPSDGQRRLATGDMDGFYLKGDPDETKAAKAKIALDEAPDGDYKYTLSLLAGETEKMIGAYKGSHVNIGFVGDKVEDGGQKDIVKALFKFNSDYSFSTKIGTEEFWIGTYSTYVTFSYRGASQIEFKANLYEFGEPPHTNAITVAPESFAFRPGQGNTLKVTLDPIDSADEVKVTSENEAIAKVNKNLYVTAVAAGETNLVVTSGKVEKKVPVTVAGEALNFGTKENPLSVDEAIALLAVFGNKVQTSQRMWVKGVVSTSEKENAQYGTRNIWLKNDSKEKAFELYGAEIKPTAGTFSGDVDALKGYEVVADGWGVLYNTTSELTNKDLLGAYDYAAVHLAEDKRDPATGIKVTPDEISINVGAEQAITVEALPAGAALPADPELSWKEATEAAEIVSGQLKIRGLAAGTATLVVTCDEFEEEIPVTVSDPTPVTGVTDVIDPDFTGLPVPATGQGATYADWSNKTGESGAVYAGNSAISGDKYGDPVGLLQLRYDTSNASKRAGIWTTTSGGTLASITIDFHNQTVDGREVLIFASHSAYSSIADVATDGDAVATLTKASNSYTFTADYEFICIRTKSGAAYINSISIVWAEE